MEDLDFEEEKKEKEEKVLVKEVERVKVGYLVQEVLVKGVNLAKEVDWVMEVKVVNSEDLVMEVGLVMEVEKEVVWKVVKVANEVMEMAEVLGVLNFQSHMCNLEVMELFHQQLYFVQTLLFLYYVQFVMKIVWNNRKVHHILFGLQLLLKVHS